MAIEVETNIASPKTSGGKTSTGRHSNSAKADETPQPPDASLTPAERKVAEQLAPLYFGLGQAVGMFAFAAQDKGIAGVGNGLQAHAEEAAKQWVLLGRRNSTVKAWIANIIEGVGIGGLIGVHVMIIAPLLVNRGFLPTMLAPDYAPEETTGPAE